jgi:hypothetical protein
VLPAFQDADQLAELATASDLPDLTADDLDEIADRYASGFKVGDRGAERSRDGDGPADPEARR